MIATHIPRNGLYGLIDRSEPIFCMWSEPPPAITPAAKRLFSGWKYRSRS